MENQYEIKNRNRNRNQFHYTPILCQLCLTSHVEISMPCVGMHSYCFSCIKKWSINKKELTCPGCRKVCENIIKMPIFTKT